MGLAAFLIVLNLLLEAMLIVTLATFHDQIAAVLSGTALVLQGACT